MCLIDRHLQVFLAILPRSRARVCVCGCIFVSVLVSSIHRGRERPMFDLYLGHPITSDTPDNINQGDVLLFGHRLLLVAMTVAISGYCFCPGG